MRTSDCPADLSCLNELLSFALLLLQLLPGPHSFLILALSLLVLPESQYTDHCPWACTHQQVTISPGVMLEQVCCAFTRVPKIRCVANASPVLQAWQHPRPVCCLVHSLSAWSSMSAWSLGFGFSILAYLTSVQCMLRAHAQGKFAATGRRMHPGHLTSAWDQTYLFRFLVKGRSWHRGRVGA